MPQRNVHPYWPDGCDQQGRRPRSTDPDGPSDAEAGDDLGAFRGVLYALAAVVGVAAVVANAWGWL